MRELNVFYSQPFGKRDEKDIFREREIVRTILQNEFPERSVVIIDQYHQNVPKTKYLKTKTWCLSNDILMMENAGLVVFSPDWHTSLGCQIERKICEKYGIDFITLRYKKVKDDLYAISL